MKKEKSSEKRAKGNEKTTKLNQRFQISDADAELIDQELGIKPIRNRLSTPRLYSASPFSGNFQDQPPRSKSDGEFLVKSSAATPKPLVLINLVSQDTILEYLRLASDSALNMQELNEANVNRILMTTQKFISDFPDKEIQLWKSFSSEKPIQKIAMEVFHKMKSVFSLVDYPKLQSRQLFTIELRGIECLDELNIRPFLFEFFQMTYLVIQYTYLKNHNKNIQIAECEEALQQYREKMSEIPIDTALSLLKNEILILANSLRVQLFLYHNNLFDDWSRFATPDAQNNFCPCIGLLLDALKSKNFVDCIYFPFSIPNEPASEILENTSNQAVSVLYFSIRTNEKNHYEIGVCNIIDAYLCHSQSVNEKITKPLHILEELDLEDTGAVSRCLLELFTKNSPKFEQKSDKESLRKSQDRLPFFTTQQMRFKTCQSHPVQNNLICNYYVAANLRLFNALRSEIASTRFLNLLCAGKFIFTTEAEPQQKRAKTLFASNGDE